MVSAPGVYPSSILRPSSYPSDNKAKFKINDNPKIKDKSSPAEHKQVHFSDIMRYRNLANEGKDWFGYLVFKERTGSYNETRINQYKDKDSDARQCPEYKTDFHERYHDEAKYETALKLIPKKQWVKLQKTGILDVKKIKGFQEFMGRLRLSNSQEWLSSSPYWNLKGAKEGSLYPLRVFNGDRLAKD